MNLILFIGFGYFCFNQVILTSTDKIDDGNISGEIFKSIEFPLCRHTEFKTQLMDLNDDCLFLVLKQLDFLSLLSIAEINNQFKSIVSIILKQIFRNQLVDITLFKYSNYLRFPSVLVYDDYIKIENLTIAEQVLKNFGHVVQKLKIKCIYPERDDVTKSIYKLVNLHCSKTLNEIWLDNSVKNFLEEFINPFENVQNIYIRDNFETNRRLNEIFPSVRRLDFLMFKILNADSINVKYENLEHLKLYFSAYTSPSNDNLAAELIRKNQHIRSLILGQASVKLMKTAADSLPQLERLKLDHIQCKYNNESITFANVKIFDMEGSCVDCLLSNVTFGNVEEIRTDGLAESMFGETGFLALNNNLKKLQLVSSGTTYLHTDTFKQLSRTNSTLKDISINKVSRVEVETILQLLESNNQLERLEIHFLRNSYFESISKVLCERISDVWSINDSPSDEFKIIFKKKHISF